MQGAGEQSARRNDAFLWSQHTILEREISLAEGELERPPMGLLLSGVIAGSGVTLGPLLRAVVHSLAGTEATAFPVELIMAAVYSVGFIVVIVGHTDLFTEYTTMAILPVLSGQASVKALGRLWALVFTGNLVGVAVFSALVVVLGPHLQVVAPGVFEAGAQRLVAPSAWVILLSGLLAGWLMGLLSWLVSASGETFGEVIFVFLIASTIGLGHLHHSISGTGEVLMGLWTGDALTWRDAAHFLAWTTLGNALGGVVFAVLIRYSVVLRGTRGTATPR